MSTPDFVLAGFVAGCTGVMGVRLFDEGHRIAGIAVAMIAMIVFTVVTHIGHRRDRQQEER